MSYEFKSTIDGFKSTSYESKSTSYKFKITSYEFKSTSYEFKFTSYKFKFTSQKTKSTSYKIKSTSYKIKSTSEIAKRKLEEVKRKNSELKNIEFHDFTVSNEFFFTKEAPMQSITDIVLLGFSLILLPGMFISYYTIIYFFVNNFFFECLYFSEYDIRMFLFAFWLRNRPSIKYVRNQGNGGGHPKGGERYHASCVRTHLHYLFSCFCHMVSCFICSNLGLRHIVQYISAIVFKNFFWNNPTA